jgi:hypothetical protein
VCQILDAVDERPHDLNLNKRICKWHFGRTSYGGCDRDVVTQTIPVTLPWQYTVSVWFRKDAPGARGVFCVNWRGAPGYTDDPFCIVASASTALTERNPKAEPLSSDRRRSIVIRVFSIGPSETALGPID